jgi:Ca2+-binding EF-hand superfamily protein
VDQDLQVFKVLDEDQSGLIERTEMRTAAARLAARDLDHDYCITFDEFVPSANASMTPEVAALMAMQEAPPPVHSELLRDAREPVMASRLIRTYDSDKDAKLSKEELNWDAARVTVLDENRDGVLAVAELSKIADAEPDVHCDLELSVSKEATSQSEAVEKIAVKADAADATKSPKKDRVQLISTRSSASVRALDGGMIEIKQPSTTITISYRSRNPIDEAMKNARETFNAIDLDGNGYMDRDEILTHTRFQRYLFDAMDADHDDRVFTKEMDEYVKGIAEPAATICQVTLFDSGNGYFQMLDRNGDGRISIRELRTAEDHLLSHAVGDATELNPSQMPRYFRIELQRGGPTLFGTGNRPRAEVPQPIIQTNNGPIWFQRADRNGDGDLIWDEFIGPRDVFDRLDKDKDGLIDPAEANAAG